MTNVEVTNVKNRYLSIVDWFEVRVAGTPNLAKLAAAGYNYHEDKGTPAYSHVFETEQYIIQWGIKHSYIEEQYTHIKLANKLLYLPMFLNNPDKITLYVKRLVGKFFIANPCIYVSRVDLAYDFMQNSEHFDNIKYRFENKTIHNKIRRYAEFSGTYKGQSFVNYTCGYRGGRFFYRLYDKTIENLSVKVVNKRQNIVGVKKDYIDNLHKANFDFDCHVYRFEIEIKPQRKELAKFSLLALINQFQKNFFANVPSSPIRLDDAYERKLNSELTQKELVQLLNLLDKFEKVHKSGVFDSPTLLDMRIMINKDLASKQPHVIVDAPRVFKFDEFDELDVLLNKSDAFNDIKYNTL